MATATIEEYGRRVLPHLVLAAQKRETIPYKVLAAKGGFHVRPLNHALGYIRDELCLPRKLPMINVIVVNLSTGKPGHSFLPEGTASLTTEQYQQAFESHRDEVFSYQGWDDLLREIGLAPIEKSADDLDEEGRAHNDVMERKGETGEGAEHYQLKQFIAHHPSLLGLSAQDFAIEFPFVSGDHCDVVFTLGEPGMAVVEVKQGERGELVKGIYQAIKYRALLQAEKGHGAEYPVQAHLVAYRIPEDIASFAGRFAIHCHVVNQEIVLQWAGR